MSIPGLKLCLTLSGPLSICARAMLRCSACQLSCPADEATVQDDFPDWGTASEDRIDENKLVQDVIIISSFNCVRPECSGLAMTHRVMT